MQPGFLLSIFSRTLAATLLTACAMGLTGCGDDDLPTDLPTDPPRDALADAPTAALPTVASYTAEEKVAHAFERLTRGPGQLGGLLVKEVHRRNLELATADLLFYEVQTSALLSDPKTVARITGDVRRYGDAWSNILRVLLSFRAHPVELVVAWARPTLDLPRAEEMNALRLEAARVLSLVSDPAAADVLLALFEDAPADREIGQLALSSLCRHPAYRERTLEIAMREGPGGLWQNAAPRIIGSIPESERDAGVAGALVWWQALTAGSGPRMDTTLPHLKSQPWTQARLGVDPSVPPRVTSAKGRPQLRYGSLSSTIVYGSGWYGTSLSSQPVLPAHAMIFTGKLPAGDARCLLARMGYATYAAAVRADLQLEAIDEGLYFTAKHCMLDATPSSDSMLQLQIAVMLDTPGLWDVARVRKLQRLVASIGSCGDPAVWDQLVRVLHVVRPLDIGRPVLEQAYDTMYGRENDLRKIIVAMLEGDEADDVGVAMHMIGRARDPLYLDALERQLALVQAADRKRLLQRTLTFLYSAGREIEPARYQAFVGEYEKWLSSEGPQRFQTMATGLLDFRDAGELAFARGLAGPKRHLFVMAWPRDRRLVPLEVAKALIAPLDRKTPAAELNHVLALAWSNFPEAAGPWLEALGRRLRDPVSRARVAAALDRVLHRAPRHGRQ